MYRRYRRGSDLEDTDKLDWVISTTREGGKERRTMKRRLGTAKKNIRRKGQQKTRGCVIRRRTQALKNNNCGSLGNITRV